MSLSCGSTFVDVSKVTGGAAVQSYYTTIPVPEVLYRKEKRPSALLLPTFSFAACVLLGITVGSYFGRSNEGILGDHSHAVTNLFWTTEEAVKQSKDTVKQEQADAKKAVRSIRSQARDAVASIGTTGRRATDAVRDVVRDISDALPAAVKKPVVVIPLAVGLGQFAVSQGYVDDLLDAAGDAANATGRAIQKASDTVADGAKSAWDFAQDHPAVTAGVVAAATIPTMIDAFNVDRDDVDRASRRVRSKVNDATDNINDAKDSAAHHIDDAAHNLKVKANEAKDHVAHAYNAAVKKA